MTIRARHYPTNDFEVALDAPPTCIAADWQSKSEDIDWAPHGASEDRHNKVKFLSIVCPTVASWPSVASLLGRTFSILHSPKRVSIELRALEALLHQRVRCFNHHCWQSKPVSSLGLVPLQDFAHTLAGMPLTRPTYPATDFDGADTRSTHRPSAYVRGANCLHRSAGCPLGVYDVKEQFRIKLP
jgi:hypothetical protein